MFAEYRFVCANFLFYVLFNINMYIHIKVYDINTATDGEERHQRQSRAAHETNASYTCTVKAGGGTSRGQPQQDSISVSGTGDVEPKMQGTELGDRK